jgi:hydrogenase expression/formation protein HypC
MCLAIPGKVIEIAPDAQGVRYGKANFGGIVKQVCLEYTPEVQCGDYVLVHVGFALGKVDQAEAERTYRLLDEMDQLSELETPELESPALPRQAEAQSSGSARTKRRASQSQNSTLRAD